MTTTTHKGLTTGARNATLDDLARILKQQHDAKLDAVVPATAIRSANGNLYVQGLGFEAQAGLDPDAVGVFTPTATMDEHLAEKLGIPLAYLRRMRETRADLYDGNVNGWLHGFRTPEDVEPCENDPRYSNPDPRRFLVRTFTSIDGPGIGRALLSDSYAAFDYLDTLTACLAAVRDTGKDVEVVACDLSERRMVIKMACPEIAAMAPRLLGGYRASVDGYDRGWTLERLAKSYSPDHLGWDMSRGEYPPVVFAGFDVSTSETGGGATTITPCLRVAACKNGLKITADAMRKVHLGGRLDQGTVRWSTDTYRKNVELVSAMTRDAVAACLDPDYLAAKIAGIEAKAGAPLTMPAAETVKMVGKNLAYSEAQTDAVLDHFIRGGQMTAGGVLNAVTSAAQGFGADVAYDMEAHALEVLDLVPAP